MSDLSTRFPLLGRVWRVARLTWSEFRGDRCLDRSASLAYVSLLGIFALVAIVLSVSSILFHDTGSERIETLFEEFVFERILPIDVTDDGLEDLLVAQTDYSFPLQSPAEVREFEALQEEIEQRETSIAETAQVRGEIQETIMASFRDLLDKFLVFKESAIGVGAIGIVGLIVVSMMLFNQIERGFNDVYHVRRRRHVWTVMTSYFMILVLAPLGIGYSLALSTQLGESMGWVSPRVTSVALVGLIFTLAYWLVPNTRVSLPFALIGGFAASVVWELAKRGFILYIERVPSMQSILLSIGVVPLFLIWLFLTWVVVFLGLELCYVLQHYSPLAGRLLQRGAPLELNPRHLLTALYEMAQRFDGGDPQVSVQDLMRATNLDENSVHVLLDHCEDKGWVMASVPHAIYHIAKPPERIELAEVLLRPVSQVIDLNAPPSGRGLEAFWQEYHRSVERSMPAKTLRDLINIASEAERAKADAS